MGVKKIFIDGFWVEQAAGGGPDNNAIHKNIDAEISALPEKVTPVDDDVLLGENSEDGFSKIKIKKSALGGGSSLPVDDTTFIAQDPADNTKKIRFDLGASTTGAETTLGVQSSGNRTIVFPDSTGVILLNLVEDTTPQLGGNLDENGFTIAGRDVATDGTKLDAIEALADVTDATNVAAAGALMKTGGTMSGDLDMGSQDIDNYKTATSIAEHDNGNSGTSKTIDFNNGQFQKVTLTGNVTYTFTAPLGPGTFILKVDHGGGGFTQTFPATVKWEAGTVPTWSAGAGAIDLIAVYYDGTNYYCGARLDNS